MTEREIRQKFLDFFKNKEHQVVESASLVPHNDPTLLFTNAGMVQFKDVFLGLDKRAYTRATTSQKCVRAGGKHNDLDTVGRTARHHTFFEMLGNFSFGDYFKKEAITYCWEFLTKVLQIPKEKLYVTVYYNDQEAYDLWQEIAHLSDERIIRLGDKDNFWSMGDTGPCGPCSEVMYDRGLDHRCQAENCAIGACDCDRWLEIWNLVFMQYDRNEKGELKPLPHPSIDTGMGLERIASVIQGVDSNYETLTFKRIISYIEAATDRRYQKDNKGFPFRVIADHARACTFLIADGVLPSNDGRGYVLRRILRRAVRFVKELGLEKPFLYSVVDVVVELMQDAYPEIADKQDYIKKVIRLEEEKFQETLNEGLVVANEIVGKTKKEGLKMISGQDAFILYDRYGFPMDLTEDFAEEKGLQVDKEGFERSMAEQRERARAARQDKGAFDDLLTMATLLQDVEATSFAGYEKDQAQGEIKALIQAEEMKTQVEPGTEFYLVLDATPFYAESGGQIADKGSIFDLGGEKIAEVEDVQKLPKGIYLHQARALKKIQTGMKVEAVIDIDRNRDVARNHTATHILHEALRRVLGDHVHQAGSLVMPQRLRFDFSHFHALTKEEVKKVEDIANDIVMKNIGIETLETDVETAKKQGAKALFGEKYGDKVRMVSIGEYSKELCGGTHCSGTGEIGLIKVVSEAGVGSGLRRIEAVTGRYARKYFLEIETLNQAASQLLKVKPEDILRKIENLMDELKVQEKENEQLQAKLLQNDMGSIIEQQAKINDVNTLIAEVKVADMNQLRELSDQLKTKLGSGIIVIGAVLGDKVNFVVSVSQDMQERGYHAGKMIKEVAKAAGGGGGGRPDMAQAGGKKPENLAEALAVAKTLI